MRASHSDPVPMIRNQRSAATSETGSDESVSHVFFALLDASLQVYLHLSKSQGESRF